MSISHESVNRFLQRKAYTGQDLFNEAKLTLNLKGGTLSVDDSVLDKPYSQTMALVSHFWSGKHHRTVKGINLVTLYYTDVHGQHPGHAGRCVGLGYGTGFCDRRQWVQLRGQS